MTLKRTLPRILSSLAAGAGAVMVTSTLRLVDSYDIAIEQARLMQPIVEHAQNGKSFSQKTEDRIDAMGRTHQTRFLLDGLPATKEFKWLIYTSGSVFFVAVGWLERTRRTKNKEEKLVEPWDNVPAPTLTKNGPLSGQTRGS